MHRSTMIVMGAAALCLGVAAPECGDTSIVPNDDVTVRPGQGNLDEYLGLLVKYNPVGASFIEFTLGGSRADEVTLNLYNFWTDNAPNQNIQVRAAEYDFDEAVLTWDTAPDTSGWPVVAGPFNVSGPAQWYTLDITDFYNSHLGATVTFYLEAVSGSGDGPIFVDREGTDVPEAGYDNDVSNGPRIDVRSGGGETGTEPVIQEVWPDPDVAQSGVEYRKQLVLTQGTEPVTWSVVSGPTGVTVDAAGYVSGWTPTQFDEGKRFTIRIQAQNSYGSDVEAWDVEVQETASDSARQWEMYEIVLHGTSNPANPFTDVSLQARVTAPDGRTLTVDGFYDGDGRGGQDGTVWKIRLSPDQVGTWTWVTSSNDPGLDGVAGQVQVSRSASHGPVMADGRSFRYADGTPVFLLGNFLDRAAPAYEEFSHTLLSELISEENRQNMIARHRDFHQANKMNIYLANKGDYGGISTTPWVGSASSNDKTRFDLARWQMYDRIVAQLQSEGMAAELWFFADDSGFGDAMSTADRQRLIQYGMARLSAYPHTMFVLCLEWQEGWSSSTVAADSNFAQAHNPWNRVWSVHGTTGNFSFPNEPWADFMATQSGNSIDPSGNNSHTVYNRSLAPKPLVVEEFGILETDYDTRLRGNLWAAFCGGAAGTGTGSDLARLRYFIESSGVPFETMWPDNGVVSGAFGLTNGDVAVAYLQAGGTVNVRLGAGTFDAYWFNPRASDGGDPWRSIGRIAGDTTVTAPDGQDWVFYCERVN